MKRINYRYTNLPKLLLFVNILIYVLLWALSIVLIAFFKLDGFHENFNYALTIPLYTIYFAVPLLLLIQNKFFYGEYDDCVI